MDKLKYGFFIAQLISKDIAGVLTQEDRKVLDAWRHESGDNEKHYNNLRDEFLSGAVSIDEIDAETERYWNLFIKLQTGPQIPLYRRKVVQIAAAIIIPIFIALGIILSLERQTPLIEKNTIALLSNDAKLILPDGSIIVMDATTENNRIVEKSDIVLLRENGRLIHQKTSESQPITKEVKWGTIEVPKGVKFDMVLEDGTQVWLNADSRLRFPLLFSGSERRVVLEGEAYFIVTEDREHPFIVETTKQSLTVLGTEFNIYAYPQGTAEYATLIDGKVSVSTSERDDAIILSLGQQAVLSSESNSYIVHKVATEQIAAWREGFFVLEGNSMEEVFQMLSRWYDFKYSFEDDSVSKLVFSGNLRITEDVKLIFNAIESLGHVEIKVEDNSVRILRKQMK